MGGEDAEDVVASVEEMSAQAEEALAAAQSLADMSVDDEGQRSHVRARKGDTAMNRQNRDNWDDYGCISENQLVSAEAAQALAQDASHQEEGSPPNEPQAEQPHPVEEKMPVASARD